MRMTVVTTRSGELVAAGFGDHTMPNPDDSGEPHGPGAPVIRAGLLAGPDQVLHVLDVADDLVRVESVQEFHRLLTAHVADATKARKR
jgi:hypothetical protein